MMSPLAVVAHWTSAIDRIVPKSSRRMFRFSRGARCPEGCGAYANHCRGVCVRGDDQ